MAVRSGQTVRISRASKLYPGHLARVSAIFQNGWVSVKPDGAGRNGSLTIHERDLEPIDGAAFTIAQAEQHGYRGFELGFAQSDNPHRDGTAEARAWEDGYRIAEQDAELEKRDQAMKRALAELQS
jgi:hypothetical protein